MVLNKSRPALIWYPESKENCTDNVSLDDGETSITPSDKLLSDFATSNMGCLAHNILETMLQKDSEILHHK